MMIEKKRKLVVATENIKVKEMAFLGVHQVMDVDRNFLIFSPNRVSYNVQPWDTLYYTLLTSY